MVLLCTSCDSRCWNNYSGSLKFKTKSPFQNSLLASLISFTVGSLGLGLIFLLMITNKSEVLPTIKTLKQPEWWMWLGGLFGAFYIFTTVVTAPKIGFANTLSLIITGQIILATLFDHFGLVGNAIHPINIFRAIGLLFLVVGAYIIQTN